MNIFMRLGSHQPHKIMLQDIKRFPQLCIQSQTNTMKKLILLLFILPFFGAHAQSYFPPKIGTWETTSPASLGWCTNQIDSLYQFLENNNTKGFLVLHDGKIVLEKYFGTFTVDSNWYWASAAKSLTSVLVGKVQEQGLLSIQDTSSKYLGNGWTSATLQQEQAIKVFHQLTMTTGLNDNVPDNHCTSPVCLQYEAPAGTKWAYHNAPYTLLDSVLIKATGSTLNQLTTALVKNKTGMTGIWLKQGYNNAYYSNVRSFARFGLLAQHGFIWDNDSILVDQTYANAMTNTSNPYNLSYGYLWWLNGKPSYMLPTVDFVIPGSVAPEAPADMFAGIGKNGQVVSISRSQNLVVVRMGDPPGTDVEVPTEFTNQIWKQFNKVLCASNTATTEVSQSVSLHVYPNPTHDRLTISGIEQPESVTILDMQGKATQASLEQTSIDLTPFAPGVYVLVVKANGVVYQQKFTKLP